MANRWDHQHPIRLVGGFEAELSPSESNAWNEYIVAHDAHKNYQALHIAARVLESCVSGGETARAGELSLTYAQIGAAEHELYLIAKQWYAALLAKEGAEIVAVAK